MTRHIIRLFFFPSHMTLLAVIYAILGTSPRGGERRRRQDKHRRKFNIHGASEATIKLITTDFPSTQVGLCTASAVQIICILVSTLISALACGYGCLQQLALIILALPSS